MSKTFDFSEYSRQSLKGIVVMYGNLIIKIFKATWFVFLLLFTKLNLLSTSGKNYLILGLSVLFIFLLIRSYLLFRNFQFKIEGTYFILKRGIFSKKDTAIAFDRIQNINFSQNLIQQLINVYEVRIETAGSDKTEISIKALSLEAAEALREIISVKKKPITEEETEIIEDKVPPLLKIDFKSLFKVSLSENHIQSLGIFLALLIGFYQQIQDVFKNFVGEDVLKGYMSKGKDLIFGSLMLMVGLFIILLIIAIISSFIRVFLRHYDLIFTIKDNAFEIKQGLINKKLIVLKREKVQSITITTNPIKKKLGISYVVFKQAVSGVINKKKDKLIKIVGCNAYQLSQIKHTLFTTEELETTEKERPHVYYQQRIILRNLLFVLLLNLGVYFFSEMIHLVYINLLFIPLLTIISYQKIKKKYFKFSENLLMVGGGIIETKATYIALFKIQNIETVQTIFQRRRNIVNIVLQTAAGKIKIPSVPTNRAMEIYNHILYKVETSNEKWM
ncbi:PH domain-containing protein [Tenacibaculum amylolyticum]|uniref:PH domain-containing protein n=1 Tax=Tenacibaculum amylolyticum TaxID=104269 RepID=UPI0038948FE5